MARYTVRVRSPKPAAEAFDYMADLSNFAEWDPGVVEVDQTKGSGGGPDAIYDVTVKAVPKPMVLSYHTISYDSPALVVVRAESKLLTSVDTITVRAEGSGSVVTYDAELTLNGFLGFMDPLVGLAFNRIGGRAASGLVKALDGERVAEESS